MDHFYTLEEYCRGINVSAPRDAQLDIRSFAENMPTVIKQMPPFRHEFYAIAVKASGSGFAQTGTRKTPKDHTLFFNSPYQLTSWDIQPDWEGFYVIFTQEFLAKTPAFADFLLVFPFLRMDKALPLPLSPEAAAPLLHTLAAIHQEHRSDHADRMALIQAHLLVLLQYAKRHYNLQDIPEDATQDNRNRDLQLISRYQALIEITLAQDELAEPAASPHSPAYYAEQLAVHPNHLNALCKRITGKTALALLHERTLIAARALLAQTQLSIKEVAYSLHFREPAHFSNFFKKHTAQTPGQYRNSLSE